ncbi:hypothetical protein [uncultured Williamsia sp.]|uniref:hypothetical protein n=1 Tax=uncultured Williamsia sp. TaxID=259311 RepID=UPI002620B4E4|nr:hypothetical protein [uncultured Williamsia sp.]
MADDWDFEIARAALREQVARRSAAQRIPRTPTGAVLLRHRVATTAALATVASAVVVGSWWAAAGGPAQSTAITSDARSVSGAAAPAPGPFPALATVGGVQVVSVPAPGGGWVQVIVGPVATTVVGPVTAIPLGPVPEVAAPLTRSGSLTGSTVAPGEEVASKPVVAAPAPARSGGGGAPNPPPPPPRTSTTAPPPAGPPPVSTPTTDPTISSPVEPPPTATATPTPDTPGAGDQTGSGAAQSGETGTSGTS